MFFASFLVRLSYNLETRRRMRKLDPLDSGDQPKAKKKTSGAAMMITTAYKSVVMYMGIEVDADTEGSFFS